MSGQLEKICVKCAKDIRNLERSKDSQGRYWCMDCYRAAVAKQKARQGSKARSHETARAANDPGTDDHMMAALLDESLVESAPSSVCPNCKRQIAGGTVVCLSCGYNAQSGQVLTTTARNRSKADKALEKVGEAGRKVEGPMLVLLSVIGGGIGGLVGAGVWAGVAYYLHVEIGWLAWGVGLLTGGGVALCAKGYTGLTTGLIATAIAILSIVGGKFLVSSIVVDEAMHGIDMTEPPSRADGLSWMATDVAAEWEAGGRQLDWPAGMDNSIAWEREDFPSDVWAEAKDRWESMSTDEQDAYLESETTFGEEDAIATIATDIADEREAAGERLNWPPGMDNSIAWAPEEFPEDVWAEAERQWNEKTLDAKQAFIDSEKRRAEFEMNQAFADAATTGVFLSTFGLLDIVFFILAIGTAFTVGSGGDLSD